MTAAPDTGTEVAPLSLQTEVYATGDASPEAPATKLPLTSKLTFALGDSIDGLSTTALATFHLFFLTVVCGLPGTLAGASTAIALIVDGLVDPTIGSLSDNLRSRHGRRHPFMFASLIPIGLAVGLTFSVPSGISMGWTFAYVTGVTILLRISYSFFTLPFFAMGAELTSDYVERSHLNVYRMLVNTGAALLVQGLGYRVFMAGDKGLFNRVAYAKFGWTIALILIATGLACAYGTLKERYRLKAPSSHAAPIARRLFIEIVEVFRNRSFVVLFATVLLFWIAQASAGVMALHLAKFFWKLPNEIIQYIAFATTIGLFVGIPLTGLVTQYVEKKSVVIWTLVLNCSYQGVLPVMRMLHLLPENGAGLYDLLITVGFLTGVAGSVNGIFFQSMMADAADEHEYLFGTRREGLYFAGITVSAKAAFAAGLFIGGVSLDTIGLPRDLATNAEALKNLSSHVTNMLAVVGGPLPAVISTVSLVLMMFYRLDRTEAARIAAALQERRTKGG